MKIFLVTINNNIILCTCDTKEKAEIVSSALTWLESKTVPKFKQVLITKHQIVETVIY